MNNFIPEDKIESGAGERKWVRTIFYGRSKEDVMEKIKNCFRNYPPQGYDTYVKSQPKENINGVYFGVVERFSSCD